MLRERERVNQYKVGVGKKRVGKQGFRAGSIRPVLGPKNAFPTPAANARLFLG